MTDRLGEGLFSHTTSTYDGTYKSDLLEQYKLYVQSAENVSARRVASSRYLLTLNVALVALYGLQSSDIGSNWWALLIPILGSLVSVLWLRIIKSHRDLNTIKFGIIHELEQSLPAALFEREWRLAERGQGKLYRAVTDIERWIPGAFLGLHTVLLVALATNALNAYCATARL